MKPYNPFQNGMEKWDIDWSVGTVRVIDDGNFAVIVLEEKDGRLIVLNIVEHK